MTKKFSLGSEKTRCLFAALLGAVSLMTSAGHAAILKHVRINIPFLTNDSTT